MAEDFSFFFSSEKQQPGGRPLAELIKLVGYLIWGNDPGSFHLLVVAIHTISALLLARLSWRQGMSLRMGFVGGLLFLVNVAHFRAVHWIAAIEFPLALSCGLGALLCYQNYLEDRRSRWLWGYYVGSVLSVSALSAMALLWPLCLYWSWLTGHGLRASLRPLLPLFPVVALEGGCHSCSHSREREYLACYRPIHGGRSLQSHSWRGEASALDTEPAAYHCALAAHPIVRSGVLGALCWCRSACRSRSTRVPEPPSPVSVGGLDTAFDSTLLAGD